MKIRGQEVHAPSEEGIELVLLALEKLYAAPPSPPAAPDAAPTQPPELEGDTPRIYAPRIFSVSFGWIVRAEDCQKLERELAAAKSLETELRRETAKMLQRAIDAEQSLAALQQRVDSDSEVCCGKYDTCEKRCVPLVREQRQRYAALSVKCAGLEKDTRDKAFAECARICDDESKTYYIAGDFPKATAATMCKQAIDAAIAQGEKA